MLKLFCLAVGDGNGAIFSVDMDKQRETVADLKKKIKEQNDYHGFPAKDLALFLAKEKGDGDEDEAEEAWLREDDPEVVALSKIKAPEEAARLLLSGGATKMKETFRIGNPAFHFPSDDARQDGEIQVLVVVPPERALKRQRTMRIMEVEDAPVPRSQ